MKTYHLTWTLSRWRIGRKRWSITFNKLTTRGVYLWLGFWRVNLWWEEKR